MRLARAGRWLSRVLAVTVVMAALCLAPAQAAGQAFFEGAGDKTPPQPRATSWMAKKAKLSPFSPARTPWGEPDLRGFYADNGISSDSIEAIGRLDATTPPAETFIVDPADGKVTRPWTMNVPLVRRDPQELWEHACHEGNAHHEEGTQSLGFKWYRGVVPPKP